MSAYLCDCEPDDTLLAARLILSSREREWIPTELLSQPAPWLQAHDLMLGYACERVEEYLERERESMRREHGGQPARA